MLDLFRQADARAALKIYVSLDPNVKISKKDYPEDVVAVVEKEKRRSTKRGTGTLKVGSNPSGGIGIDVLPGAPGKIHLPGKRLQQRRDLE